jgi:hypothetical protein
MALATALAARIEKLEAELADLRSMIIDLQPPQMRRMPPTTNITRADIGESAKAALIEIAGRESLDTWGLLSIYQNDGRIGGFTLEANRVYPGKDVSRVNVTRFAFVGGPGPIILVDESQETLAEPAWGVAGIFPYLVRSETAFFNGHIPSNASCADWFPGIYNALRFCNG